MDLPKEFDDRHWWIVVTIAGVLIAVASAPVKFVPGVIIGLGLLAFGVGQWIDHPLQAEVGYGYTTTRYAWRASVSGVILSLAGGGLVIFGLYRLLAA